MPLQRNDQSLLKALESRRLNGYLVYYASDRWWSGLFGAFGHCSLFINRYGFWIEVQHHYSHTFIDIHPGGYRWQKGLPEGAIVQPFLREVSLNGIRCPHLLQPFTCVETVKAILGINRWSIVTPRQLYRYISHGIEEKAQAPTSTA